MKFQLVKDIYVTLKQFPLCVAYAVSIHKSQGLSLDAAVIDIGTSVFKDGMRYAALSPSRTLTGLYIINVAFNKICAERKCIIEYNRLRTMHQPNLPLFPLLSDITTNDVISDRIKPLKRQQSANRARSPATLEKHL